VCVGGEIIITPGEAMEAVGSDRVVRKRIA